METLERSCKDASRTFFDEFSSFKIIVKMVEIDSTCEKGLLEEIKQSDEPDLMIRDVMLA